MTSGWVEAAVLSTVSLVAIVAGGCATPPTMPICAIDMGSNTFRRILGSFSNGRYEQLALDARTLGVGDDLVRHGRISDGKLAEIRAVLATFKSACDASDAVRIVAIGTAAFRDAPNGRAAVEAAASLGIPMEIATEARESELAYLVGSLGQEGYAVIDNGSRSIELVSAVEGTRPHHVISLGYRVAYQHYFAAGADPAAAVNAFANELQKAATGAPFMRGKAKLVGVEFGEMADVLFAAEGRASLVFTVDQLRRRLNEIKASSANEVDRLKRTENIDRALPRLVVAATLTEAFGYSQFEITRRELGTGLIIEAGLMHEHRQE